jgi:hypothetical protein
MQRKQLRRGAMTRFFANSALCLIDTETCGSSHHWVRKLDEFEQMLVHPDGESSYGVYNTPLFNFCCVAIRCNNALSRLAKNKKSRALNPIQPRFLGLNLKASVDHYPG